MYICVSLCVYTYLQLPKGLVFLPSGPELPVYFWSLYLQLRGSCVPFGFLDLLACCALGLQPSSRSQGSL